MLLDYHRKFHKYGTIELILDCDIKKLYWGKLRKSMSLWQEGVS